MQLPWLKEAVDKINEISSLSKSAKVSVPDGLRQRLELDNLLIAGEMVVKTALFRTESRGAHYREDYPAEDEKWLKNLLIVNNGQITIEAVQEPYYS
jgi:fumarate reductase (CoM/CoB) subunit A